MLKKAITKKEVCSQLIKKYYKDRGILFKDKMLANEIFMNITNFSRVLDAGCGSDAAVISKYCKNAGEAIGVDVLTKFRVPPWVKTYTADLESLPFKDNYFDVIISKDVCEHLSRPFKVFKELRRVLNPKGKIIIVTPNKYSYSSVISNMLPTSLKAYFLKKIYKEEAYDNFPTFYRCNTKQSIKKITEKSGLRIEKIVSIRHYPYYLMFSVILFRLGILYDGMISMFRLNCLKSGFLVVLRKQIYEEK